MQFTVEIKQSVIESVKKYAEEMRKMLSQAEDQNQHAATVGILKDRVRDLCDQA